jgi:LPS sulfotransferase NodH
VLPDADYPKWSGLPLRTLLICTQQRSGSTLLGEAIYFAERLGCPLEYFHVGFQPFFERRWNTHGLDDYVAAVHRQRTDPSGVLSVKLFWRDILELARKLGSHGLEPLLRAEIPDRRSASYKAVFAAIAGVFPRPTFVFLTRRDTVRQALSLSVAGQTRKWRRFADNPRARAGEPHYSFDEIAQELARIQNNNAHWLGFFEANDLQRHEVAYEDLVENYVATLRELFRFLGRSDAPIAPPRLRKQADPSSEELLRRFLIEFRQRASGGD